MWRTLYALRWHIAYLVVVAAICVTVSVLVVLEQHRRIVDAPRIGIRDIYGQEIPVAVAPSTSRETVAAVFRRIDQTSPFVIQIDRCVGRSHARPYRGRHAVLYVFCYVQLPDGSWRQLRIPFTSDCERDAADDALLRSLELALPY